MTVAYGVFGLYFLLILFGAGCATLSKSLVRALAGLFISFMGVAGMYLLMQAPFLAFMQLLIYVGAVCVLVFFALMLTQAHSKGDEANNTLKKTFHALFPAGLSFIVLAPALFIDPLPSLTNPQETSIQSLGQSLLQEYALPFELISVVLFIAMTGGVFLIWERRGK